ncbi:MAG: sensor histidine kinase, partial [Flavobacteriales bacterium]|nr:sensor histidine kinase [Flavobacteriales bacterium]
MPRWSSFRLRSTYPFWLLGLMAACSSSVHAQWGNTNLDSIARLLDPKERSMEQLQRYDRLAAHWLVSAKAMRYLPYVDTLSRALLAEAKGDTRPDLLRIRANYHHRMGYQLKFRRDIPGALRHFERSWSILDSIAPRSAAANAIEAIGVLYEAVGEPGLAMRYYDSTLVRVLQGDPVDRMKEGSVRRHIASVLIQQDRYRQADSVLARCDTSIIDVRILVATLHARMFARQGDTARSEAEYLRAVQLADMQPSDWGKLDPLASLSRLRSAHRDHRRALDAATACADIAARTGDEAAWCTCMILAGKSHLALGDGPNAEHDLRAALDTARAYGYHGLARINGDEGSMVTAAGLLRDIYLHNGMMREAVAMTTYWSDLKDTLNRRDGRLGVLRHRMRSEAQADSAAAANRLHVARLRADRFRDSSFVLGIFVLLLALIALLLYRTMRHRQRLAKKEKELHDEQVDQLLSQQEMKSINAMLEGQEKERERVGKELHDHVGSLLGAIKHQLGVLEEQVADVKTEQTAQYHKVSGLLDNAAGELRRISHDMAAATLNRFGLEKALQDLRDTLHINGRLQVELNTFGLEQPLQRGVEIAVYRIIQEAVSNVLKHAKASELSIAVTHAPGRLSVVVSDNGIGFDTSATSTGVGLANIRSRAAALGAQAQIDSATGKGTTVSVEW